MDKPEISIKRLAEIFVEQGESVFGFDGTVRLSQSPDPFYLSDVPNRRCPNISKAREHLGFAPTVDVEEGVRRYLEFLKLEADQ
jgi:UDP-glucuronate decarboxylase